MTTDRNGGIHSRIARALRVDTDGAVSVIALFMALFLVGMLYYSLGIARAIVLRERMQDAADAAAFSAAVVDARGLNLIALTNLINAAALAVLLALQLIQAVTLAAIARLPPGDPDEPELDTLRVEVATQLARPDVGGTVTMAMRASSRAAAALRDGTPSVAEGRALRVVRATYRARVAFVYAQPTLPTALDAGDSICTRAAAFSNLVGTTPFQALTLSLDTQQFVSNTTATRAETIAASSCPRPIDMRPQAVTEPLGSEAFQVRAFVVGESDPGIEDRGVRIANRWRDDSYGTGRIGRELAGFAGITIAQAESFFDDPNADPEDLVWDTQWRARLRRVWFPTTLAVGDIARACERTTSSGSCNAVSRLDLDFLGKVIVH